mgnify:CR=1 FL=1
MQEHRIGFLDNFTLKIIAIIAMTIDHIGYMFIARNTTEYLIFRGIGRIAFPIFCFLIVEGFHHTKSPINYLIRLLLFALISEIPFDLAFFHTTFDWKHQNVFFTLAIGLSCLFCLEEMKTKKWFGIFLFVLFGIAYIIRCDYGVGGVMLICMFYFTGNFKDRFWMQFILSGLIFFLFYGSPELPGLIAIILVNLYNGKRGYNKAQWIFYIFYPLHLIILHAIYLHVI